MLNASIIGATGLVGAHLLKRLLDDGRFGRVVSLGRRKTGLVSPKLEEHVVDFEATAAWAPYVTGDCAFSALGTTRAQAGGTGPQRRVDYDYQLAFAKAAAQSGIKSYALCSAASANADSRAFYSRMKGELERDVQGLGFKRVRIVRPSLLVGDREKARTAENVGSVMLAAVNAVGLLRRYRPIHGDVVAQAMVNAVFDPAPGTRIYELDEVFVEAGRLP